MEIDVRHGLSAPPERTWPLLTVPDQMNRWSRAHIVGGVPGPGGRFDVAGATRHVEVRVLGVVSRLDEVVVEADPPHRFVYRVLPGGAIRDHLGTQTLTATSAGCELRWHVRFRTVPGLGRIIRALLLPQIEASVRALASIVA